MTTDYFFGHKRDEPHPYMPATGTEGKCELCGQGSDSALHTTETGQVDATAGEPSEGEVSEASFYLERIEDESGISGTGRVAQGFVFEDGTCALRWLTKHRSTAIYSSLEELQAIHGHNGKTRVVFEGREPDEETS